MNRIQSALELIKPKFRFSDRIIMSFVGGSELHGAKLYGTDDTDLYGIFIEPPEFIAGLDKMEHFVWSTSSDAVRNQSSDIDVTVYSLKKWANLAIKGNPTCLNFMYWRYNGQVFHPIWNDIAEKYKLFISQRSVKQFTGFADAQLKRMTGEKGLGKHGQRPELELKFGYDTKAAMHTIRLLFECLEFITTGVITLPRPQNELDILIPIRKGEWTEDRVIREANRMFEQCKEALAKSPLPEEPDHQAVSKLVADSYLKYWKERGETGESAITPVTFTCKMQPPLLY